MAPLRWGIASAGKISNDFCVAFTTLPAKHHKVVAVAARGEASVKKFANLFNILAFYGGYEKLAVDSNVGMRPTKYKILNNKVLRQRKRNNDVNNKIMKVTDVVF